MRKKRRVSLPGLALLACLAPLTFLALLAFLLAPVAADALRKARAQQPAGRAIAIETVPFEAFSRLDPDRRRFGDLTFLGGLELRGKDPAFGGLSGLSMEADGLGFVAISDQAHWVSGMIRERDGRPIGVDSVRIAPMLAPDGSRLKDTRWFDSEGLTRLGAAYFVSVERSHDILRFEARPGEIAGRARLLPAPEGMKKLNSNQGIEALGVMPAQSADPGALIAIAEHPPKGAATDRFPGFLIGGKAPGTFGLRRRGDFDVTDLGFLPGGDLLVLERRFTPFFGLGFRIRRIAGASIRPGALLDGAILIEADLSMQIDNMEALGIHRGRDGRVVLTLLSDDNFSIFQRTLLLRFAMDE